MSSYFVCALCALRKQLGAAFMYLDNERHPGAQFKVGVLAPNVVLSELPAAPINKPNKSQTRHDGIHVNNWHAFACCMPKLSRHNTHEGGWDSIQPTKQGSNQRSTLASAQAFLQPTNKPAGVVSASCRASCRCVSCVRPFRSCCTGC